MRRYNIINDTLGWICFLIAALTYLLTIEPTASFWDCPEFITQGYKLEVGHPPGNPIFMLTARFFVTLFGGGAETAAMAVNSMSALLSAGTILLLFWTITYLVKKLMVRDGEGEISLMKTVVIMGAGLCGALAYTWSDTFWFSAVEGEVYAFSSFCTALVFWLILKWEARSDDPRSDRYLILIAYIIGVSIAVHLLNLLCIPAIVLVYYYKKFQKTNVLGSLVALGISFVIVALILFGLVPGFVAVAQRFELFFVNTCGMSYNMGVLIYAIITVAVFIGTIWLIRQQKSALGIRAGVVLSIILSGMPFVGHGWVVPTLLIIGLIGYVFTAKVRIRVYNNIILSVFVIFIGYSSYALLLIRSTANTPMNQNAPDNVFTLGSYLNREQYGDTPLLSGPVMSETISYSVGADEEGNEVEYLPVDKNGYPILNMEVIPPVAFTDDGAIIDNGSDNYIKIVKSDESEPDHYVKMDHKPEYQTPSGMNMLLTRMYSYDPKHVDGYKKWSNYSLDKLWSDVPRDVLEHWRSRGFATRYEIEEVINEEGSVEITDNVRVGNILDHDVRVWQPGFWDNMSYFLNYQLNHMYWRYFMWNFAGRQNDMQNMDGEPHLGNWITGFSFLDDARLGDQSLLPSEYTTDNPGHNVFYMLPLLLGILGIVWQALMRHRGGEKRGVEQFWVIFFLFFMTGIAIVFYLNQTPGQPRERDYAFAGSFYAFAIWIGMGVPAIFDMLRKLFKVQSAECRVQSAESTVQSGDATDKKPSMLLWGIAGFAVLVGLIVPIQMVSQTWDDHDRSGRYAARDFGMNYLNSLDENAIIFVNGDNDTFPLWYAQEVEGVRTDVKVVNLSYLSQDWYARQVASTTYDAQGVPFYMPFDKMNYANVRYQVMPVGYNMDIKTSVSASDMLRNMYENGKSIPDDNSVYYLLGGYDQVYVPMNKANIEAKFGRLPSDWERDSDSEGVSKYKSMSRWDLTPHKYMQSSSSQFTELLTYDIIARTATQGFKRPVYFASTVGPSYSMGFRPYMFYTGMAQQVTPFNKENGEVSPVAVKGYNNVVGKFRWGGLDGDKKIYLDETVRRMVTSTRTSIIMIARDLMATPGEKAPESARRISKKMKLPIPATYADMAQNLLTLMDRKMPTWQAPYENSIEYEIATIYTQVGVYLKNRKDLLYAKKVLTDYMARVEKLMDYAQTLSDAKRSEFYMSEVSTFYHYTMADSFLQYINLELSVMDGKIDAADLDVNVRRIANEGYEGLELAVSRSYFNAEQDAKAKAVLQNFTGNIAKVINNLKTLDDSTRDYYMNRVFDYSKRTVLQTVAYEAIIDLWQAAEKDKVATEDVEAAEKDKVATEDVEAAEKDKVATEDVEAAEWLLTGSDKESILFQAFIFVSEPSSKELEYYKRDGLGELGEQLEAIKSLFRKAGVDYKKGANRFMKEARFVPQTWMEWIGG